MSSCRKHALKSRRGLTLVEVVVSTLIVAMMTVAALNALGAATRSSTSTANRAIAVGLAEDLAAEIVNAAYKEPVASPVFGPEGSEVNGPRSAFNDVDDYNGWSEQPPKTKTGTSLTDRADWRRRVVVERVVPATPTQTTPGSTDQGAKRVHVIVEYDGQHVLAQIVIRTDNE